MNPGKLSRGDARPPGSAIRDQQHEGISPRAVRWVFRRRKWGTLPTRTVPGVRGKVAQLRQNEVLRVPPELPGGWTAMTPTSSRRKHIRAASRGPGWCGRKNPGRKTTHRRRHSAFGLRQAPFPVQRDYSSVRAPRPSVETAARGIGARRGRSRGQGACVSSSQGKTIVQNGAETMLGLARRCVGQSLVGH